MLKYSKEFLIISSPPLRYKRNSLLLSTYPRKRWREQLMLRYAVFDRGIKICTTLPLGFLCSAGFLDHRVIILAVMDLTKIAANGICAWCLFSMHLRLVYPLASFACPPPGLCSMCEPRLPVPLPSHYRHKPRGAAKALRGEACGSGNNAASASSNMYAV